MHTALRRTGTAALALTLLLAAGCNPEGGGTVTPTVAPTEPATTTTQAPTTTSSSTTTSTSTTSTSTTTSTTVKKSETYVDPGGKFRFTHPGWIRGEDQEGFANFVVLDAGLHRFSIKHQVGQLSQTNCRNNKGTVVTTALSGGRTTPFCRQPSENGKGVNFIGFPPVGSTSVGVIVFTADPAATEMPPSVKEALTSLAP